MTWRISSPMRFASACSRSTSVPCGRVLSWRGCGAISSTLAMPLRKRLVFLVISSGHPLFRNLNLTNRRIRQQSIKQVFRGATFYRSRAPAWECSPRRSSAVSLKFTTGRSPSTPTPSRSSGHWKYRTCSGQCRQLRLADFLIPCNLQPKTLDCRAALAMTAPPRSSLRGAQRRGSPAPPTDFITFHRVAMDVLRFLPAHCLPLNLLRMGAFLPKLVFPIGLVRSLR